MRPQEQFGCNLRRFREAAGLTQMQLGNRCDMDMAEISRHERGLRDPRLNTIVRLAEGLQLDPADLIRGIRLLT